MSQHQTAPLLYAQLTSFGIRACVTSAHTRVQLPEHRSSRTSTRHKHYSTTAAHDASRQGTPVPQLLGRFSEIERLNWV